jgi:hypothetical protein
MFPEQNSLLKRMRGSRGSLNSNLWRCGIGQAGGALGADSFSILNNCWNKIRAVENGPQTI